MKTYDSYIYKSGPLRNATPSSSRTNPKISYSKRGYSIEPRDQLHMNDIEPNDNINGLITQAKARPITSIGSPSNSIRLNSHK
jgi:hypothetical protein